MKTYLKFLFVFLVSAPTYIVAGSCSHQAIKKGCYNDEYYCNIPTHYSCQRCVCEYTEVLLCPNGEEPYCTEGAKKPVCDKVLEAL